MSHVALLPAVPPLSDPKPAVPAEASDDPLAELVRVMSAELMGGATPAPGGEAAPASEAVAAEAGVANQLEAKLADDLKALSSAFQSDPPLPAAPAAPTSEPAPSAAEPAPAEAKAESPAAQSLPSTPVAHDGSVSPPSNAEAVPPSPSGLERATGAAGRRVAAPPMQPALRREHPAISPPAPAEKRATAVSLPPRKPKPSRVSPAGRPAVVHPMINALGKAAKEKPEPARRRPPVAAAPPAIDAGTVRLADSRETRSAKSSVVASDPTPFARAARPVPPLSPPKATEPPESELPKEGQFRGGVEEEAAPPEDRDALPGFQLEEPDDEPPIFGAIDPLSRRRVPASFVLGGVAAAIVLAAGVTYVMVRSEKPTAIPVIVAAVPSAAPAASDRQRLPPDRVDGPPSADQTKLATPGNTAAAEVPVSSGAGNNPISRPIEPAGPGVASAFPSGNATTDRPATNDAATSDDSADIAVKKARGFVIGPPVPAPGGNAASDAGAGGVAPAASATVPPSATPVPARGAGAAEARSGIASGRTEMDDILDNKGAPIAVNPDPLGLGGGNNKAAEASAGAAPARRPSPEPATVTASDAGSAVGAAATDSAPAMPAPQARVPVPPVKPIVASEKARKAPPTAPPVASSGDVY